jgi:hypothetical protein
MIYQPSMLYLSVLKDNELFIYFVCEKITNDEKMVSTESISVPLVRWLCYFISCYSSLGCNIPFWTLLHGYLSICMPILWNRHRIYNIYLFSIFWIKQYNSKMYFLVRYIPNSVIWRNRLAIFIFVSNIQYIIIHSQCSLIR